MAERTKFLPYCIYSAVISAVVYPIEAGWVWNGQGWLAKLGFVDFAGSAVIHMVGGIAALIGAILLGPRIGKYTKRKDGSVQVHAIPGHSLTMGALRPPPVGAEGGGGGPLPRGRAAAAQVDRFLSRYTNLQYSRRT